MAWTVSVVVSSSSDPPFDGCAPARAGVSSSMASTFGSTFSRSDSFAGAFFTVFFTMSSTGAYTGLCVAASTVCNSLDLVARA